MLWLHFLLPSQILWVIKTMWEILRAFPSSSPKMMFWIIQILPCLNQLALCLASLLTPRFFFLSSLLPPTGGIKWDWSRNVHGKTSSTKQMDEKTNKNQWNNENVIQPVWRSGPEPEGCWRSLLDRKPTHKDQQIDFLLLCHHYNVH